MYINVYRFLLYLSSSNLQNYKACGLQKSLPTALHGSLLVKIEVREVACTVCGQCLYVYV